MFMYCYSIVELETNWEKETCRVRKFHILSYLVLGLPCI